MSKPVVALGMSGGVDSSAAAYLLRQKGYEVLGITMLLIDQGEKAVEDARAVADKLGIQHYTVDFRRQFQETVIAYFLAAYDRGQTPNPCVWCNAKIKFGLLYEYARSLGAEKIATGHYAKIARTQNGQALLRKGDDKAKDQSYFLFAIEQAMLSDIIFPLGRYTKGQVRELARTLALPVANKPDSQEVCFIPDNDYKNYLLKATGRAAFEPGRFVDTAGKTLGTHQGIQCYTIGQRKGLGLALGVPAYVVDIHARRKEVTVGLEQDLYHQSLLATAINLHWPLPMDTPIAIEAKIRYRAQAEPARLILRANHTAEVTFTAPQRAITPGQGVCFYHNDLVLGGGFIAKAWD